MNRPVRTITSIQTQKAHPDRVSLFIDGEFAIGLRRELVFHLGLRAGMAVTEEDFVCWQREENRLNAFDLAVRYLSVRGRSRQQVLDYLSRKGFDEETAKSAVKRLEAYGYLNDERFASDFVRQRIESKPRGKKMIRWELRQKGIPGDTIEHALAAYEDETEAAARLISRRSAFLKTGDPEKNKKLEIKIARLLARHGFSASTIRTVIRQWRQS